MHISLLTLLYLVATLFGTYGASAVQSVVPSCFVFAIDVNFVDKVADSTVVDIARACETAASVS